MSDNDDYDLYAYLHTQFTDLASAKAFMKRWATEMNQQIPGFGGISSRALASHASTVLEGKTETPSVAFSTNYMATKYGSELFWAAWS